MRKIVEFCSFVNRRTGQKRYNGPQKGTTGHHNLGYLGLDSIVRPDVRILPGASIKAEGHIMLSRDGYIPQSAAAMAVDGLFSVISRKLHLNNGLGEALLASRVDVLKAVDQNLEVQHLVEQLVFRIAGQFADQDYDSL